MAQQTDRRAAQAGAGEGIQPFRFDAPTGQDAPKVSFNMLKSERLNLRIQVLDKDGGETNLHAHAAEDAVWFVLSGRVRWHDGEDHTFAEYGPWEGIAIPRAAAYWFESASDEPLAIMRASALNTKAHNTRLNFTPRVARQVERDGVQPELRDITKHNSKPMTSIKYDSPEFEERPKVSMRIWASDLLSISAQKIRDGGETNLHSHTATDEAWYILAGRARFYGREPADTWEFGPNEGTYIPAGTPYWFESASDEPLELLRFGATLPDVKAERLNYEKLRGWQEGYLGGRDAGPDDKR